MKRLLAGLRTRSNHLLLWLGDNSRLLLGTVSFLAMSVGFGLWLREFGAGLFLGGAIIFGLMLYAHLRGV